MARPLYDVFITPLLFSVPFHSKYLVNINMLTLFMFGFKTQCNGTGSNCKSNNKVVILARHLTDISNYTLGFTGL